MELLPHPESLLPPGRPPRSPINILDGLLRQGVQCQREGRLPDAERVYRRILAIDPRHAATLYRLGTLAHKVGHLEAAAHLVAAAIAVDPLVPAYHCAWAALLLAQGRSLEAAAAYRHALSLDPTSAVALVNLEALGAARVHAPHPLGQVLDIA